MPFSWMWRRVVIVRTDVPEEHIASNFRVERIRDLRRTLAVTSSIITANVVPTLRIVSTLKMEATRFYETSVLTSLTWLHIP
jgi:hypothetical protein